METVTVYSPIEDKKIKTELNNSPIWKEAIHEDDFATIQRNKKPMYEYKIKFDGLKPTQVTSVKKI